MNLPSPSLLPKMDKNMIIPPNHEVGTEVGVSRKGWRRPFLLFLPIVILALMFLACCGSTVRLLVNNCDDLSRFRQRIDVSPLMDVEIPAAMDLTTWEDSQASIRSISSNGVHINVERLSSVAGARMRFESQCSSRWQDADPTFGGEGDERYCLSYVRTARSGPEGLCTAMGYYHSYVIVQKENVVIAIYERATEQASLAKETAVRELAEELTHAARAGR